MRRTAMSLLLGLLPSALAFFGSYPTHARLGSSGLASATVEDAVEATSLPSGAPGQYAAPFNEIDRRRNLAIIAHPDAGKTTLTEKLLLYGGAVQEAGAVRTRANQRSATSDFMELEKQRGISISSTVLSFDYLGRRVNLLDTPGHQDFSEDTYRTLAACDNAVCLVDAAKGLEPQTRKLLEVCRLSGLPIFTFCNKMDRPSLEPLELIDQIEREFGLTCYPMVWPIGSGPEFQGVLDREDRTVHLFERGDRQGKAKDKAVLSLDDPLLESAIGRELYAKLMEDAALLADLIEPLDLARVASGDQSPMFFGSAMNNFGVELFLEKFLRMGCTPGSMPLFQAGSQASTFSGSRGSGSLKGGDGTESGGPRVEPTHSEFSGFVFKLQANLDPKHRDRLAYVRIVSGKFEKGMKVVHSRSKKALTLAQAQTLFASDRENVVTAYPGDVIGINNPAGLLAIGDALYTGSARIRFRGIPSFSPEVFAYVSNANPGKYKNYRKGLKELLEEGAVNMLRDRDDDGNGRPILAAVGQLQFDVVQYRLEHEYGVETKLEPLGFSMARWCGGGWAAVDAAKADGKIFGAHLAKDRWERPVLLFRNEWKVQQLKDTEAEHGLGLTPVAVAPEVE